MLPGHSVSPHILFSHILCHESIRLALIEKQSINNQCKAFVE